MPERKLVNFIKEARRRSFSDLQIRHALLEKGWPVDKIEKAFQSLNPKSKFKNQVCIFLNDELLEKLEKRAKKNMFTISEQIEDILRRSSLNKKRIPAEEKLDDKLVSLFSRKKKIKK